MITRQMLRRNYSHPGDSKFITGEQVERAERWPRTTVSKPMAYGARPVRSHAARVITKASLSTDSFIAAARSRKRPGADRSSDHQKDDFEA